MFFSGVATGTTQLRMKDSVQEAAHKVYKFHFFCSEIPVSLLTKSGADNYRTQQF